RDPHDSVFEALETMLDHFEDPALAGSLIVRFELHILSELGFGLDLLSCAASGATADLAFVSPKSGRAVSRLSGEPWRDRLLKLPDFLLEETDVAPSAQDLVDGFALTGFFLARHVLEPRGLPLPDVRAHFLTALAKASPSAA
ncbi:MAG: DNA repair protein RecO, partial [Pseudorhodoplanes sp.]